MKHSAHLWRVSRGGFLLLAASLAAAPCARAQASGDGFLFRRPDGSFRIWGGYDRALANSPIFAFITDTLTLSKSSFGAFAIGGDLAFRVAPRLDLMVSAAWAGSRAGSEYRNWMDNSNQPIRQTTTLERVPLTVSLKWYLDSPGRSIGHFAWVPAAVTPFVGVGGGLMWYRFHQYGDFIDFADSSVVSDDLESDNWTGTLHAFAGLDVALGPRYILTGRAQYAWAKSHLGSDFVGANSVDLSGLSLTVGAGVRF
jgi:hypothetical protein